MKSTSFYRRKSSIHKGNHKRKLPSKALSRVKSNELIITLIIIRGSETIITIL